MSYGYDIIGENLQWWENYKFLHYVSYLNKILFSCFNFRLIFRPRTIIVFIKNSKYGYAIQFMHHITPLERLSIVHYGHLNKIPYKLPFIPKKFIRIIPTWYCYTSVGMSLMGVDV